VVYDHLQRSKTAKTGQAYGKSKTYRASEWQSHRG